MTEQRVFLVVDDNAVNRDLARIVLTKQGWTVDVAASGEEALLKMEGCRYEQVLLDLCMPGLSGEETCQRMRSFLGVEGIRIIAYTAHAFPEDYSRILAAGFDRIIVKPVSIKALIDAIS